MLCAPYKIVVTLFYGRFWFYIKILYGIKTVNTFVQDNKLNLLNLCFDSSTRVPVVMATC